ncbi:MAG: hypothetical protein AAGC77_02555 [Pseudomonadota bacterium]
MTSSFDLIVIGDDEAALCAAACAGQAGARAAIIRTQDKGAPQLGNPSPSCARVPNFVWRRLNLNAYGLHLDPVSARITLFADGGAISTGVEPRATAFTLADEAPSDSALWSSFVDDLRVLSEADLLTGAATSAVLNGADLPARLYEDPRALGAVRTLSGSCAAILDDYFEHDPLKLHVAAHALGASGLGGEEPGSALTLTELFEEDAWRVRAPASGPSVKNALIASCRAEGVSIIDDDLMSISKRRSKYHLVETSADEAIKSRFVMFATPEAAAQQGVIDASSPLSAPGAAVAVLRLKMRKPIKAPNGDDRAVFQIVGDAAELQSARDAVVDGRLPDQLPLAFEFCDNGDIIARTSYCPARFRMDGEWRAWTGQDRQAASARMTERLSKRLRNLSENVAASEIEIFGEGDPNSRASISPLSDVIVQPQRHNAISAAVKLVDRILSLD